VHYLAFQVDRTFRDQRDIVDPVKHVEDAGLVDLVPGHQAAVIRLFEQLCTRHIDAEKAAGLDADVRIMGMFNLLKR
jgi:hypothetical protein